VTLPIILAYLRSNNHEKEFWKKTIRHLDQNKDDLSKAIEIVNKYKCIEDTIERAKHFANVAKDSLGIFSESEYKEILTNLVNSGITRLN